MRSLCQEALRSCLTCHERLEAQPARRLTLAGSWTQLPAALIHRAEGDLIPLPTPHPSRSTTLCLPWGDGPATRDPAGVGDLEDSGYLLAP